MHRSSFLLALALIACGDDSSPAPKLAVPTRMAIVADWLNGSISYLDLDALARGASTRAELAPVVIPLPEYPPGPIDVAITPDKRTALVSSSTGFFAIPGAGLLIGNANLPTGPGKLLMLDIDSGEVKAALDAGPGPMAIAITPDGKRAIAANLGSGDLGSANASLVVVDVEARTILDSIPVGSFAEEVAFDETGTVGILSYGTAGSVRTFKVADPRGTLSPEIKLPGDSAGVAFFPGTKVAYVVQAPSILDIVGGGAPLAGYTLVDADTGRVVEDFRSPEGAVGYPVTAAKNRDSLLVPVTFDGRLVLREYKLSGDKAMLVDSIDIGEASLLAALGIAYDGDKTALIAWPSARSLVAVDLAAKTSRVIPWGDAAGPADVAFR
jgi:DNA-binding beta-propeller fold protein YncE